MPHRWLVLLVALLLGAPAIVTGQESALSSGVTDREVATDDEVSTDEAVRTDDVVSGEDEPKDEFDEFDEFGEWDDGSEVDPVYTISGFAEIAAGQRLSPDPAIDREETLRDARLQLRGKRSFSASSIDFRGDVHADGVTDKIRAEVRELAWQGDLGFLAERGKQVDIKLGRQVLSWGTGEYLFLNDLFPKDFRSFFAGRDDEYLKRPSVTARLSGYFDAANVDLALTPRFTPDRGITGEYFSFYDPEVRANVADAPSVPDENRPDGQEVAARIYRTLFGTEWALYGYRGYDKLPVASDAQGRPRYGRLNVYGASAVRSLGSGIGKLEYAFHERLKNDGSDFQGPNDQSRLLLVYDRELSPGLSGALQWYVEHTHDHEAQPATEPGATSAATTRPALSSERTRHLLTARLIYSALRQTLTLEAFVFHSPTDHDGYTRLGLRYSPTDRWQLKIGSNFFHGQRDRGFYGQFKDASNVYAAFRFFY